MIKFRDVSLVYPNSEQTIFENLNFSLADGEFVLVIGHTGTGKSSILRLINGLVPHHTGGILSGEIEVAGRSTRLLKPGELSDVVGIVAQNPINGFVCEIVEDEIAFTLETLGVAPDVMRKRIEEILDLLSLTPLRERLITSLSGGEQQRVAIAAALVTQPKVLLLDEPTSALDPIAAEEVLSILHRLVHDLGLTVVIAEHRLERVIQFVDRILLIREPNKVELGFTKEILADSPIAPPLVELAKVLGSREIPLSVREFRKQAPEIANKRIGVHENLNEILVQIEGVSAAYQDKDRQLVLRDISLELRSGEIVALMGRNGAGKSTLLRSLVGLTPVTSGAITVCGQDPKKFSSRQLIAAIGYVPQEASDLLIEDSVAKECERADRDNGCTPGRTLEIYRSLLDVGDVSVHPRDLSEGQKLGLALSVLLSAEPRILVLDEPTRGMDYEAKKRLIAILKSQLLSDRAVILATHDVELVAELANRVLFIADGELIASGTTQEVLTASPAFAPQVVKAFPDQGWLTVAEIQEELKP